MPDTQAAKPKPIRPKKYLLVRYGQMNTLGLFEHNEAEAPKVPTRIVVKTEKGLELGYLVGLAATYRGGQFRYNQQQLQDYYDKSEVEFSCEPVGRFVRYATPADISEEKHLRKIAKEEIDVCKKLIQELNLPMRIVDAEHILGGERIVYYFKADSRVDFRELVKRLAREYQTRIEMRQIGSRDEAKLLGDVESCGQQCCCQRFLKALKPVNMRMAKTQKATLDPSKISGYCGRLKCCLRYEDETYTELKRRLPRRNTIVQTPKGKGKVIDGQILTQLVMVEYENGDKEAVGIETIEIVGQPSGQPVERDKIDDEQTDLNQQPKNERDEELDEQFEEEQFPE